MSSKKTKLVGVIFSAVAICIITGMAVFANTQTSIFKELDELEFYFSSGAGGWRTKLYIDESGSFSGTYTDYNFGSDYPNGECYRCDFEGEFTDAKKINEYTYSLKIENLIFLNEPGTTEVIDDCLHIYSMPYGIENTDEILLYLPGTPISELPDGYMSWIRGCYNENETELPFYGLYNEKEETGFSSHMKGSADY